MYISHISLFLHTHFLNQLVFPGVLFRFPKSNKKCLVVFADLRGPLKTQDRSSPATFAPSLPLASQSYVKHYSYRHA